MSEHLILCVDDNSSCLQFLRMLFETQGYRVLCASSGHDGLTIFASHPIDLVVLDYEMPRLKGDSVAALMKLLKPTVPVLLYSSFPPVDAPRLVDAVVEKGGRTEFLLAQIFELLNRAFTPNA